MEKQIIITISREYGSGGHYIAEKISKELGIKLLDHNMLDHISAERGIDLAKLKKYDELPKKVFGSRTVRGMSNSIEENVAKMQFDYIKEKSDEGVSMIVVGRCGDYLFKDNESAIKIFVLADKKEKIKRIMEVRGMSESQAKKAIARHDYNRKMYHNTFANAKWGDSRNYDLCINSSRLGLDQTKEYILEYIKKRVGR